MEINLEEINIRSIEKHDNEALAKVVRDTLAEFGANRLGTVYYDETTDHLFEVFQKPRAIYYVSEYKGEIMGGGGIYPSDGLDEDTCELVKMYLRKKVRGIGLGRHLIEKCIDFARQAGYKQIYIETMPELKQALKTYEKFGFEYIDHPMGSTGHFGCDLWLLKKL